MERGKNLERQRKNKKARKTTPTSQKATVAISGMVEMNYGEIGKDQVGVAIGARFGVTTNGKTTHGKNNNGMAAITRN